MILVQNHQQQLNGNDGSFCFGELKTKCYIRILILFAEVAELVDALDSKSSVGNNVWVRVPPSVQEPSL
jgi:hypothetical protein